MSKDLSDYLNKKNFSFILIIIIILSVGLIPGRSILGTYESLTYYYNFAALEAPLNFLISRDANIVDPAVFSLGFSRLILEFFNIYPTLSNYRILSVLYGFITLILFFIIVKRWFGFMPALIVTALLSVNPLFHLQQHTMTQLMFSALAFIFLFERLQALEFRYTSNISWIGLSLAMTFVIIHYGPGRIFALILLFFWLVKFYLAIKHHHNGNNAMKNILNKFLFSFIVCVLLLVILDWKNLFLLIQFYNIVIPPHAESFFRLGNISHSENILSTIKMNYYVMLESLTGLGNTYHGLFSTNVNIGFRYAILNPLLFVFFIAGVVVSSINLKKKVLLFSMPYFSSLLLFLICLLPLFSSIVFLKSDNPSITLSTLSSYRMFYLLFPSYLLIAAFLNFLFYKIKVRKIFYLVVLLGFFLLFLLGIKNIIYENVQLVNKLNTIDSKTWGLQAYNQWKDGTEHVDKNLESFKHAQLQSQYYNIAQQIHETFQINQNNNYYILNLNLDQLNEIKDFNFSKLNYAPIFISLYLNTLSIKTAWVQIIDQKNPMQTIGYFKSRKFSAPLIRKNNKLQYKELIDLKAYLRYFDSKIPRVILTSTKEELNFAMKFFEKNDIKSYSLHNI